MSFFKLKTKDNRARLGIIHTSHGEIETPAFMAVGTQGTVKALDARDLREAGAQIILGNTYHLHLQPGEDLIAEFGGLHKFIGWDKPILTDSGGFQVFSLDYEIDSGHKRAVSIDSDGVTFHSHLDGSEHRFTPETAIEIQHKIGADIIMAFDQCTKDDVSKEKAKAAMELTHEWAGRCVEHHKNNTGPREWKQYLFGIIQGGRFEDLREESAKAITGMPFDGIAVGGESIGYKREATRDIIDWIEGMLPEDKPRYSMGVGVSPADIFAVVERGIDMFDCVAPTRMARHGSLYVKNSQSDFRINITKEQFARDAKKIDEWCGCGMCKNHSRAYLHHLFKAKELLAYRLASIHNVHFILQLMSEIRVSIQEQEFQKLKNSWGIR